MTDSRPELETLDYKPESKKPTIAELEEILKRDGGSSIEIMPNGEIKAKEKYCPDCGNPKRKDRKGWPIQYCGNPCPPEPTSAPPATLGFNSHVIKPETRVNKAEDADQHPELCNCMECMPKSIEKQFEQPNQNLMMIIEEIEGLMSQVNEKIHKLTFSHDSSDITKKQTLWNQAIEEIDLFQKTTLFDLRKAFE